MLNIILNFGIISIICYFSWFEYLRNLKQLRNELIQTNFDNNETFF